MHITVRAFVECEIELEVNDLPEDISILECYPVSSYEKLYDWVKSPEGQLIIRTELAIQEAREE